MRMRAGCRGAEVRADMGGDTTGNGVSKLVFTILSAVAEAERDRTRERVAEVKRDQRQRGRYLGGAVPWGYRVGEDGALVPIPEQQAAIRRMRKLRDQGLALRAIADQMKASGVSISHAGVKNALTAANRLAQIGAVIGRTFSYELIAAAAGLTRFPTLMTLPARHMPVDFNSEPRGELRCSCATCANTTPAGVA